MRFSSLPNHLKPREKAKKMGIEKLNDIELLAIYIRSGTKKQDVLSTSKQIISKFGTLKQLMYADLEELKTINGIGDAKALEILALQEISKRINTLNSDRIKDVDIAIKNVINIFPKNKEKFVVLALDRDDNVIYKDIMYSGTYSSLEFDPKEVISLLMRKRAQKYYCFHNHPSGDLSATQADLLATKRLRHYSDLFAIELLGHYIVLNNGRYKLIT